MAEKAISFLITALSAVMIFNALFSIYVITANFITFSSQTTIYPPVEVIYSEFNGTTTNFSAFDEDGLKIITNLTLEVDQYGRVIFDSVTDLTVDKNQYNKIDIDGNAEFSHNYMAIDTSKLTSLRKSATVIMYNLTFDDPRILVDGFVCPPTICILMDYTNGTLVFRVNQFSYSYSAEEIPEEQPAPAGPSRPSGVIPPVSNFTTDRDFIKVSLKQGETFLEYVTIENTGEAPLTFSVSVQGLERNVAVSEESFVLKKAGSKTLVVAFTALDEGVADVYTGRLILEAGGIRKAVLLIMEVKEKRPLFDIYVNLAEVPVEVTPGGEVRADILLYNFGDVRPVDVMLFYSLRDFDGNDILFKYDTLAVQEQEQVVRKVRVPADIEPGFYVFYSRVEYGNETASSSGLIKVVKPEPGLPTIPSWIITAVTVVVLVSVILFVARKTGLKERLSGIRRRSFAPVGLTEAERARLKRIQRSGVEEGRGRYVKKLLGKIRKLH
jgi:hypothetical protein